MAEAKYFDFKWPTALFQDSAFQSTKGQDMLEIWEEWPPWPPWLHPCVSPQAINLPAERRVYFHLCNVKSASFSVTAKLNLILLAAVNHFQKFRIKETEQKSSGKLLTRSGIIAVFLPFQPLFKSNSPRLPRCRCKQCIGRIVLQKKKRSVYQFQANLFAEKTSSSKSNVPSA